MSSRIWRWGLIGFLVTVSVTVLQAQPGGPAEVKVGFDFPPKTKAIIIFNWIQNQYGVVVVRPPALDKETLTLRSDQPLNLDQTYELLLASLLVEKHYTLFDKPRRIIEIVPLSQLDKVKDRLRTLMNPKPEGLVDSQEIVLVKLTVESGTAQAMRSYVIDQLVFPNWVKIDPSPSRDALEIIATVVQVKQILGEIDRAKKMFTQDDTGLRNFYIKHVKARFAFQMLVDFLKLKEKADDPVPKPITGGAGFLNIPPPGTPQTPPPPPPQSERTGMELLKKLPSATGTVGTTTYQFYLDESASSIVAMAPPSVLALVERFLRQYDVEPLKRDQLPALPQMRSFVFNFVKVETAINLLAGLFQSIYGESSTVEATKSPGTPLPLPPPSSPTPGNPPSPSPSLPPSSQSDGTLTRDIKGRITFIADTGSNTVVVLANQDDLQLVEEAAKRFDIPAGQVLIEITVMEAALTKGWEFGIAHLIKDQFITPLQTGGEGIGVDGKILHDTRLTDQIKPSKGVDEATSFLITSSKLDTLFRILSKETIVSVVSAPKVIAQNNKRADIVIEDKVYWIQIKKEVIRGTTIGNTQTKDEVIESEVVVPSPTGLNLSVTPKINELDDVFLDIALRVDEISGPPVKANFAPIISSRNVTLSARVKRGQTIFIGGIVKNTRTKTELRTPILSSLPLIGSLFSSTIDTDGKRELVLFLSPHVMRNDPDVREELERQEKRHRVVEWPETNE